MNLSRQGASGAGRTLPGKRPCKRVQRSIPLPAMPSRPQARRGAQGDFERIATGEPSGQSLGNAQPRRVAATGQ
jgi:hypothetical protein